LNLHENTGALLPVVYRRKLVAFPRKFVAFPR